MNEKICMHINGAVQIWFNLHYFYNSDHHISVFVIIYIYLYLKVRKELL